MLYWHYYEMWCEDRMSTDSWHKIRDAWADR